MRLISVVSKELMERKARLLACFLAVFLGIALIVAVESISSSSQLAVERELDNLGANVIIVPRSVSLSEFYSCDFEQAEMPEKYVRKLLDANLPQIEKVAPKLSHKFDFNGSTVILTGIVPYLQLRKNDFISNLNEDEILIGSEIGKKMTSRGVPPTTLVDSEELDIKGKSFRVAGTLSETGTIDDVRIFAPLNEVQELLSVGEAINEIDVICRFINGVESEDKALQQLDQLLPAGRAISIKKIVKAQTSTVRSVREYSLALLVAILLAAGAGIANYMFINVRERRTEIGTLLAIGARPKVILTMFLQKAVLLGVSGGITGYLLGTAIAVFLGPALTKAQVSPRPAFLVWSILIAVIITISSTIIPARRAARLDPARIMQEE